MESIAERDGEKGLDNNTMGTQRVRQGLGGVFLPRSLHSFAAWAACRGG